jgi:hypothetical protein
MHRFLMLRFLMLLERLVTEVEQKQQNVVVARMIGLKKIIFILRRRCLVTRRWSGAWFLLRVWMTAMQRNSVYRKGLVILSWPYLLLVGTF